MNKLIKNLVFGKSAAIAVLLVAGIVFTAAFACESGGDKVPPDNEIQSLVKETTGDLANAIDTEDFSKLYAKSSSDFQSTYTVSQMKDIFKTFIENKSRVLPSLKSVSSSTATFSPLPAIRSEKGLNILVLTGEFSSKPDTVKFENEYVWRDGGWKMLKLKVNM
jgi:hypothetical protein